MTLYRARAWRGGPRRFDPLDSTGSVSGPSGWRWNDADTEILYAAEVEALATLEIAVRPGWDTIEQVLMASIEVPDGSVATPEDLGIALPSNWNARPVVDDSRRVAREFLDALGRLPAGRRPLGLRVPSVVSATDHNVILDPGRKALCRVTKTYALPFKTLRRVPS